MLGGQLFTQVLCSEILKTVIIKNSLLYSSNMRLKLNILLKETIHFAQLIPLIQYI